MAAGREPPCHFPAMLSRQSDTANKLLRIAKELIHQSDIAEARALLLSIRDLYPDDEAANEAAVLLLELQG